MNDLNTMQIVVTALLSSGLVGGLMTLLSKKVWSPESRNELARIGNEFAQQLLEEARSEREELRQTIKDLEDSLLSKEEALTKLRKIANDKDTVIEILEERQLQIARKIQQGELVSLYDIFGPLVPPEFLARFVEERKKESGNG